MTEIGTAPLGALVRERREALRMSMDELATRARISRSSLHRIEHDHPVRATPAKLSRVLTVVGVTPDEVTGVITDPEYAGDVIHWMSRSDALDQMDQALQPRPHMRPLAARPDLVVIDQQSGEVAQVSAPEAMAENLAAVLSAAGYLVTQPR